jgi:hypothetical protein
MFLGAGLNFAREFMRATRVFAAVIFVGACAIAGMPAHAGGDDQRANTAATVAATNSGTLHPPEIEHPPLAVICHLPDGDRRIALKPGQSPAAVCPRTQISSLLFPLDVSSGIPPGLGPPPGWVDPDLKPPPAHADKSGASPPATAGKQKQGAPR